MDSNVTIISRNLKVFCSEATCREITEQSHKLPLAALFPEHDLRRETELQPSEQEQDCSLSAGLCAQPFHAVLFTRWKTRDSPSLGPGERGRTGLRPQPLLSLFGRWRPRWCSKAGKDIKDRAGGKGKNPRLGNDLMSNRNRKVNSVEYCTTTKHHGYENV